MLTIVVGLEKRNAKVQLEKDASYWPYVARLRPS